ncbi:MAG TPA: LysR substrate-binding domain-containing protein, partial [Orrella sp.]
TFEGSSLETIRHMVAAGIGLTVMPVTSLMQHDQPGSQLLKYVPFKAPAPERRVVLAWRKSFPRMAAIRAFIDTIQAIDLPGVRMIDVADRALAED